MSKEQINKSCSDGGCGSLENENSLKSNVPGDCPVSCEENSEQSSESSGSGCPGGRGC
ncbi:hypothetical protein [Desulfofalx alkaliphila]|uniref:hypothetical protein n=1 Tax=Desulfofalx alkaliphila TaxID=105483 RepID=UPI000AE06F4E|nr:hypothetical protein [Desulfofalx alkaliphila]